MKSRRMSGQGVSQEGKDEKIGSKRLRFETFVEEGLNCEEGCISRTESKGENGKVWILRCRS